MWRSVPQTPLWVTRTRTWLGPRAGRSTSSGVKSRGPRRTMAFMRAAFVKRSFPDNYCDSAELEEVGASAPTFTCAHERASAPEASGPKGHLSATSDVRPKGRTSHKPFCLFFATRIFTKLRSCDLVRGSTGSNGFAG